MIDPPKFNISFSCPPYKKRNIAAVCVHVVSMNVVSLPANKRMHAAFIYVVSVYLVSLPANVCRKLCRESAANKRMHGMYICIVSRIYALKNKYEINTNKIYNK